MDFWDNLRLFFAWPRTSGVFNEGPPDEEPMQKTIMLGQKVYDSASDRFYVATLRDFSDGLLHAQLSLQYAPCGAYRQSSSEKQDEDHHSRRCTCMFSSAIWHHNDGKVLLGPHDSMRYLPVYIRTNLVAIAVPACSLFPPTKLSCWSGVSPFVRMMNEHYSSLEDVGIVTHQIERHQRLSGLDIPESMAVFAAGREGIVDTVYTNTWLHVNLSQMRQSPWSRKNIPLLPPPPCPAPPSTSLAPTPSYPSPPSTSLAPPPPPNTDSFFENLQACFRHCLLPWSRKDSPPSGPVPFAARMD